ncbi:MAG: CarD family transcriptional regulator [Clostridia bacterium]|nr:CarD family transcriptional regulator [Clostridia bacterium]
MYEIGEHIIYGTNGICRVGKIIGSPFDPSDSRPFYVLYPLYDSSNSVIYTPVDNENIVMRLPISREAAKELLESIPRLGVIDVGEEKKRREVYRSAVQSTDPEKFIRVIKTVVRRRAEFRKLRRRLPDLDNDFEHTARNCLYGELADVLGVEREEIHRKITELIESV